MSLRAWFQPPRRWLGLFLLQTLAPSGLLIWFGWHSLRQDRALALQQVQERREQAADLIVSGLEQSLESAEQSLRDPKAAEAIGKPEGAVTVIFTPDRVTAFPKERLLYNPIASAAKEAPGQLFEAAEDLEFRRADYASAAAALRSLAQSPDPAIRAGALIRLARNLRKSGRNMAALAVFAQAAEIGETVVSSVPTELLARWARCELLAEMGRTAQVTDEAGTLYSDLLHSRWQVSRATYEFHIEEVGRWIGGNPAVRPGAEAVALARAVERLWNRGQETRSSGRETMLIDGLEITILKQGDVARLTALVTAPSYVERQWLSKLSPLLDSQHARVAFRDATAKVASAVESRRSAAETGLPWTIAVESTGIQSELDGIAARRRLWLAGLALLAALVIAGTYVIARAMARELAVARLQSDFVSAVSHEFRTPLTSLRQLTEILNDDRIVNEDRRRTYYQALARQTERLHRSVESLLDFGRMEAGTSPYRVEPLEACAFVRAVVGEFEMEAAGRGYHVELDVNGARTTITGDREALTNALWNLLDNAVKYSLECRTVWVAVEREDRRLAIRVRDKGLGIPAGEQKEIFRRFVRGAAAKAGNIKGTGIGLAMVHHIVKAHGGEVCLSSEPGSGSTFTVLLPIDETCPAS
jgi:signal transduction histidine kinase